MNILNLADNCGSTVIPGIESKMYLVCACDVDVFPPYLATTNPGDSITLDGDITLTALKKFAEIDILLDSGEVKHTLGGSTGSKNYTNSLDFKVVKNKASDEWFNAHPNACFIGIVVQKDGQKRVFGTPGVPAKITTAEGTGGSTNDSEAAWTAQIMDTTGKVAPYYTGNIDLDDLT